MDLDQSSCLCRLTLVKIFFFFFFFFLDALSPLFTELGSIFTFCFFFASVQEYDSYGFSRKTFLFEEEQDTDIDPLSNKAAVLERQSEQLSSQVKVLQIYFQFVCFLLEKSEHNNHKCITHYQTTKCWS